MNGSNETSLECFYGERCWNSLVETANHAILLQSIPIVIFMLLLIVTGVFGNVLVIIVYTKLKKKTTAVLFILYLAYVDLITLVTVHPYVIFKLIHCCNQTWVVLCKILEFGIHASLCISTAILLMVSVDRFVAICLPLRYFRYQLWAKHILMGCCVTGVILSIPILMFYGKREIIMDVADRKLHGYVCDITNYFQKSSFQMMFGGVMFVCYITACTLLVVFYTCVARKAYECRKVNPQTTRRIHVNDNVSPQNESAKSCSSQLFSVTKTSSMSVKKHNTNINLGTTINISSLKSQQLEANRILPDKLKAAKMLSFVTLVFILSWMPFFVLRVISIGSADSEKEKCKESHFFNVFLNFLQHLFYVNNAVNPLIYAIMHKQFRVTCSKVLNLK